MNLVYQALKSSQGLKNLAFIDWGTVELGESLQDDQGSTKNKM